MPDLADARKRILEHSFVLPSGKLKPTRRLLRAILIHDPRFDDLYCYIGESYVAVGSIMGVTRESEMYGAFDSYPHMITLFAHEMFGQWLEEEYNIDAPFNPFFFVDEIEERARLSNTNLHCARLMLPDTQLDVSEYQRVLKWCRA